MRNLRENAQIVRNARREEEEALALLAAKF